MSRNQALATVEQHFDSGRFQAELADLITFETESQNPDQAPELTRYLEQAMMPRMTALGFQCTIHPNPALGGGPLLSAVRIEDPAFETILAYGHGDVIRAQTEQWREGLHPFRLVEEGERLYGRGVADNKGQHLIALCALEAVLAARGHLGFNVKFLIEMSEETGSAGLREFCAANKDLLAADVLLASDGPRLQTDRATLFMGSRGGATFDLSLDLREGAHHSGNWGGLLADPAMILAHALASICDRRGQIQVPEWRPTSLTADIRAALDGLPVDEEDGPTVDRDWGEESLSPAERAFGWNSFAVLAMTSGVPAAPVNAIAPSARATCQLRFVVGTDQDDILPALRRHLDRNGYQAVKIESNRGQVFAATRLDPSNPWVRFTAQSIEATTNKAPHILPNLAGSIPNDAFSEVLGLPTVWIPHSYRACSQHAPNEHVLKPVCRDALRVMTGLYWDIGARQPATP